MQMHSSVSAAAELPYAAQALPVALPVDQGGAALGCAGDYSAARAAFCLAFTAAQLAVLDEQLPGCVGDDMSAPEAAELAQRSRKAAAKVATYWPRLKPWAPAGLQALYQSTVARAVRLGAPAPPWLGGEAPALHARRVAQAAAATH